MIEITQKEDCCGCEACANICSSKCITMEPDSEGFLYPTIDVSKCVRCGACERVCPQKNNEPQNPTIGAYVVQTRDRYILEKTASGGGIFVSGQTDYF